MDRFKLMETFAAVVKQGSYTRAARELGVTRAMVSKRIQDLETALNAKLLNRNTHGLSPTATGADYHESCVALLAELHALEERTQAEHAAPRGELRILSTRSFAEMILAPVVADFCGLYPNISVHIALRDRETAPHGMDPAAGGFDLAVRTLPVRDSSLVARAIASLPRILVAAPDYLVRAGMPQSPGDLSRHNCLDPAGAGHHGWTFLGPAGRVSIRVSGTPSANSSAVIRQAALKGLGIAKLSEYLVVDNLKGGSLVRVLDDYALEERKLYVVYQRARYQPLRMRLFIDYLASHMADYFEGRAAQPAASRVPGGRRPAPARAD